MSARSGLGRSGKVPNFMDQLDRLRLGLLRLALEEDSPMPTIYEAYCALVRDPMSFLSRHLVDASVVEGVQGRCQARFVCRGDLNDDRAKFKVTTNDPGGNPALAIEAFFLPVTQYTTIENMPTYPCETPPPAQADFPGLGTRPYNLYVTTPLDACSLVSELEAPGGPKICHVQPALDMHLSMERLLKASPRRLEGSQNRPYIYGIDDYPFGTCSVIGVGRGARWRFFQQFYMANNVRGTLRAKKFTTRKRALLTQWIAR